MVPSPISTVPPYPLQAAVPKIRSLSISTVTSKPGIGSLGPLASTHAPDGSPALDPGADVDNGATPDSLDCDSAVVGGSWIGLAASVVTADSSGLSTGVDCEEVGCAVSAFCAALSPQAATVANSTTTKIGVRTFIEVGRSSTLVEFPTQPTVSQASNQRASEIRIFRPSPFGPTLYPAF